MVPKDNRWNLYMKLKIYKKEPSFGPGIGMLMKEVDALGSMSAACKKTGMAYSKAWKIVHRAEQDLGFKLFLSTSGGKNGGGMVLTPMGRDFLTAYENFEKRARECLEEMMESYFSDFIVNN